MARGAEAASTSGSSLTDYIAVIRDNRRFRILWIGELINQAGNWFSYVAALTKVEQLSGNTGFLLSLVLMTHFLPNLIFFPVSGVVADRYPRENTLLYACMCAGVTSMLIPLIQRAKDLWLLYILLMLQYSAGSFYDPARRALQPTLIPEHQLGLAATLDTFAWSLMSAVGGSLGGYAVSGIGTTGCFLLDCATYVAAGVCAQLLVCLRDQKKVECGGTVVGVPLDTGQLSRQMRLKKMASGVDVAREVAVVKSTCELSGAGNATHRQPSFDEELIPARGAEEDEESQRLLPERAEGGGDARGLPVLAVEEEGEGLSGWRLICSSFAREAGALREGMSYILEPSNRDVAVLILIKAGGSLVWGASDLFNVHFAAMPQMQSLGDQPTTLGFIFCSVGVGCLIGPVIFNYVTPTRRLPLLISSAVGYGFMAVSYLIMAIAPNVWMVLFSTAFRAVGSAVTWVYSTLLLQIRVPNSLLGRMLALEMALLTVSECVSSVFGGAVFDTFHWTVTQAVLSMAGIGGVVFLAFVIYVMRVSGTADAHPGYTSLTSDTDSEEELEEAQPELGESPRTAQRSPRLALTDEP